MTNLGWRSVFYICGALGLAWSIWWYVSYRNLPEEHRRVNRAELERIRGGDNKGKIKEAPIERQSASVPWGTAAFFEYVGDHVRLSMANS